jgi:purine nucleosidase/pyrimidine-specific ribonucleoside hydrolase
MSDTVPLVIDCDAGVDDLVGVALAALHPRARLLAVSLVGGNVPTSEGVQYVGTILALAGRGDVPVLRGLDVAPVPDGADGSSAPAAGLTAMRDLILGADRRPTLVATGSLTNVAVLLNSYPQLADALEGIVVLGGVFNGPGNSSPVAERNIFSDPESARDVLGSRVGVSLVPIDVSGEFRVPDAAFGALAASDVLLHRYLATILFPYRSYYRAVFGAEGCPLHDPLAVLLPLAPELFDLFRADVAIELRGEITRGATVIDLRPEAEMMNEDSSTRVARAVDRERAWREIASALSVP